MAKKSARAFSLIMAILFLFSTLAFTGAVLWQIYSNSNNDSQDQQTTQQASQSTKTLEGYEPMGEITELQIVDRKEGDGEVVKKGATVTAHYVGALAEDGTIFQDSHDFGQPVEFPLNKVIKGWGQGVPGMKVGGIRRLLIPYKLAYGEQGAPNGGIPPKADLVFDIEIIDVKNP